MKKLLIACLCMMGIVFVAIGAGAQEDWTAPDDDLVIDFIKPKKEIGVVFNHSSHENYECVDCHHNIKKSGEPTSCATCHDNFSAMPTKGYKSYFKAMHYKRNNTKRPSCLGCHVKEFGNDKEMTGCVNSACHPEGIK
ncbi:cytochrome c3 family protein [Desulfovibrio sp. JC022]|uniref:cytochrome c3 family protein n=1 Tax=Desulfovibrio sp. JC022 TaxID=2593642 RepID=UPI0013D8DB56|nr:cytochrome c3 family protein [Desulfovibrio sp. JC022]NDV24657.1 cytochrome c3 family protein [Desulfovibrio sp. JC022]